MSRSKRFVAGLLSGYGSIAATIAVTLVSIPLALHYLDKDEFGLWALAAQINGYLMLIELGMNGAVSRFLADHKDNVNGGEFGSQLLTGGLVFAIQGLLIAGIGIGLSWYAPSIFAIPVKLADDFSGLMMLLAIFTGCSVATRSFGAPLWAFHRNDVLNNLSTLSILVNLAGLWIGFENNWGIYSYAIAQMPMLLVNPATCAWICYRNRYYPKAGHWGKASFSIFKRTFYYGKDVLMINLGSQLINATQIMIISRFVNLEAAAVFAVSTKIYTVGMMLVANPISVAGPGLAELYVRGEHKRFTQRYWDVIALTLAVSTLVAIGIATGNRSFVSLWTNDRIHWSWTGDLILALLIVLRNLNGCLLNLFGLIKNWRPVRHVYLAEGLVFIPLAMMLAKYHGIEGVLIASLIAHLTATTALSARAAGKVIGSPMRIGKGLMASLSLVALAATINWGGSIVSLHPWPMLAATSCICLCAFFMIWRMILPAGFRNEAWERLANASHGLIKK